MRINLHYTYSTCSLTAYQVSVRDSSPRSFFDICPVGWYSSWCVLPLYALPLINAGRNGLLRFAFLKPNFGRWIFDVVIPLVALSIPPCLPYEWYYSCRSLSYAPGSSTPICSNLSCSPLHVLPLAVLPVAVIDVLPLPLLRLAVLPLRILPLTVLPLAILPLSCSSPRSYILSFSFPKSYPYVLYIAVLYIAVT